MVVKVVSVVAKSKVSLVSMGSSYLVFELVSSIGCLEFWMTYIRRDPSLACTFEWLVSGRLDELQDADGKLRFGRFELLLDLVDLTR